MCQPFSTLSPPIIDGVSVSAQSYIHHLLTPMCVSVSFSVPLISFAPTHLQLCAAFAAHERNGQGPLIRERLRRQGRQPVRGCGQAGQPHVDGGQGMDDCKHIAVFLDAKLTKYGVRCFFPTAGQGSVGRELQGLPAKVERGHEQPDAGGRPGKRICSTRIPKHDYQIVSLCLASAFRA